MSATERKIIADSDKHEEFKAMFGAKQKENSLQLLVDDKEKLEKIQNLIQKI